MRLVPALLLAASQSWAALAPGTVAYYPLTADLTDSSPNAYNATATGTVTFESVGGRSGATATWGSSNYFSFPAGLRTAMQSLTSWSWEVYVRFGTGGSNNLIFWGTQASDQYALGLFAGGATGPFRHANVNTLDTSTSMSREVWYHLAVSSDGVTRRLYIDGVQRASAVNGLTMPASITEMVGGVYGNNKTVDPMIGHLSGWRFSNINRTTFPTVDPISDEDCIPGDDPCD